MKLFPDESDTILGTARRLRSGKTSCEQVVRRCLDRIDQHEPSIRAWVVVAREDALAHARALDQELTAGKDRGPLHGIPVGIKDIFDVRGFPTRCGLAGRHGLKPVQPANTDATVVARLRDAGAVILGKTVSTPFAWIDPPVTRNPWNLDRTPGGSSSGSAAAVASGMCLAALGTQTGGSITRPASFCGVAGMKPSYGKVSARGVLPLAPSLDHPGPIARSTSDLELMYGIIRDNPTSPASHASSPPTLLVVNDFLQGSDKAPLLAALDAWAERGGSIIYRPFTIGLHRLLESHRTILAAEAAACHGPPATVAARYFEASNDVSSFPTKFAELLAQGEKILATQYIAAMRFRRPADLFGPDFPSFDAMVTTATLGPAPDSTTTGDPAMNSPWSLLGLPTVSFPIGLSADGLPLAVQLIGRAGEDVALLQTARWCETVIRSRWEEST